MTDTAGSRAPLNAIGLVARSFGLFGRRFTLFFLVAFVPSLALAYLQTIAFPGNALIEAEETGVPTAFVAVTLATTGIGVLGGLLIMAALTQAAYDTALERPVALGSYIGRTILAAPAILLLGLIYYAVFTVGLVCLILPGVYVAARYFVMTPAILIEGVGFSGLTRAADLTRGYRWSIVGVLILLFVIMLLLGGGAAVLTAIALASIPTSAGYILTLVLTSLAMAFQYAIVSIFTALLYARLRELKEGLGLNDLVSVFE